jgi:hypothetical protein
MKQLQPIQVAYRGFEHELTISWIHERIKAAIDSRALDKPLHTLPPRNETIAIHFSDSLIETWKLQYDKGHRVDVPREIWDEIDELLGIGEPAS